MEIKCTPNQEITMETEDSLPKEGPKEGTTNQGGMDEAEIIEQYIANGKRSKQGTKFKTAEHPYVPKMEQPPVGKNADGTWGPTGLYGGRVKETKLLRVLRDVVKPSRLKRVEEVLSARCQRVQCLFENLSDAANGAACLRTMEGFGLLESHAVEAYEPFTVPGGITMNAEKVFHFSHFFFFSFLFRLAHFRS